jgi:hypothetical protein
LTNTKKIADIQLSQAVFLASFCASPVLPAPCSQRLVLSKHNASSAVCQAPASFIAAISAVALASPMTAADPVAIFRIGLCHHISFL